MKRKLLAVVITAAMVAGALPGIALAAPAEEYRAEEDGTEEIQDGLNEEKMEPAEREMAGNAEEEPAEQPALSQPEELTEREAAEEPAAETEIPAAETEMTAEKAADLSQEMIRPESADVIDTQEELTAAIARGGEIDLAGQRIELTSPLSISNDVIIRGGTLVGTDNVTGNLVTLMGNNITLDQVTIQTAAANKSALHAYGTVLTVNGLTIDHSSAAGGAPVIINNGADAVFSGNIRLTLGSSSWYGINVDSAKADFSGAALSVAPVAGTQSVICREGDGASVSGVGLTVVVTGKDGGGSNQQTAYVADANLSQFVAAKTAAGADISRIELQKDVTLTVPLMLGEEMTVTGAAEGFAINGSDALGRENVVTVTAAGVELSGITIRTAAANKSALHIYKTEAALHDVTLDNTQTAGGAAMLVNGGTVRISGALNLLLGENSWGGINVDTTNGDAGVIFEDGSRVNMTGDGQNVIYVDEEDKNNGNAVTVTGAEEAGLVQDVDGNYITADAETDPEQPEDPDKDEDPSEDDGASEEENRPGDEKPAGTGNDTGGEDSSEDSAGKDKNLESSSEGNRAGAPKTGDSAGTPYAALAALIGSGAAAGIVRKKKSRLV